MKIQLYTKKGGHLPAFFSMVMQRFIEKKTYSIMKLIKLVLFVFMLSFSLEKSSPLKVSDVEYILITDEENIYQ